MRNRLRWAFRGIGFLPWLALSSCVSPRGESEALPWAAQEEEVRPFSRMAEKDTTVGPLRLSVDDAILFGLQRNRALRVEVLRPEILRAREAEARARFESTLAGSAGLGRETVAGRTDGVWSADAAERMEAELGWTQPFPTGATLGADAGWRRDETAGGLVQQHRLQAGVSVAQPLLRDLGVTVNRAAIHQARMDTLISEYELQAFSEMLAAEIENAYWDYALATRRIGIVSESAALAQQQLHEIERRIDVGALAETERAAARAEVALRREAMINANSAAETLRLHILRLLNPGGSWEREVHLLDEPALPEPLPPAEGHELRLARALELRPELRQARLSLERGELEVVRTRNGLLPRLDLFIRLGKTAYAESFSDAAADTDGEPDWHAGLRFEIPFARGAERARHDRSVMMLRQAEEALQNLVQAIQVDVRTAAIELNRSAEQISATAATRVLQEEKWRAEEEKFRVGRSTSLLVAQAQRDVMAGRIAEIEAITLYLKARVRMHRLEGTLLNRLGVTVQE